MPQQQLSHIIRQGESEKIEFKRSFSKAVIETLVAFANASGGKVLLGVKDSGNIVGVDANKESVQQWLN